MWPCCWITAHSTHGFSKGHWQLLNVKISFNALYTVKNMNYLSMTKLVYCRVGWLSSYWLWCKMKSFGSICVHVISWDFAVLLVGIYISEFNNFLKRFCGLLVWESPELLRKLDEYDFFSFFRNSFQSILVSVGIFWNVLNSLFWPFQRGSCWVHAATSLLRCYSDEGRWRERGQILIIYKI